MSTQNTHSSLKKNIGTTLTSMYLDKAGTKLGPMITPAVWVNDYIKTGKLPDMGDKVIYAGGFFSGPAAIVTGLFKSFVDDDLETKLNYVKSIEPKPYRNWINACSGYTNSPPSISAMTIATTGTTVWHHPIGIWVYITDANGFPLIDYKPVNPTVVYRPKIPLVKGKAGGYLWNKYKK